MRILTAFAFALFLTPLAAAGTDCSKAPADMTPDEYIECVSLGGVKTLAPAPVTPSDTKSYNAGTPQAAGRGTTAVGSSESDACSKAKARAGSSARGSCSCSQKSAGRFECSVATAAIYGD
jgi:hypothetical protein